MIGPEQLSPSQREAYGRLMAALPASNVFELRARTGRGRTTVLQALHATLGGALLTLRDFVERLDGRHPLAMEEVYYQTILEAMRQRETVIVNDLHVAAATMGGCGIYLRPGLIKWPLTVLTSYAASAGKRLILGGEGDAPEPVAHRAFSVTIGKLTAADYRHICAAVLGESRAGRVDAQEVHRFAPNLNGHQLRSACAWFHSAEVDTESFIDYLRSLQLASNVELGEVAEVALHDLKGVDDVIRSLEANIVIPLEHGELARELDLQPKRGVLLAGPPGTGKTTVGRALAHRLRGKFFLIDGTFISGTRDFYQMIHRVFHEAKENAPSIIFIDDCDVIFEGGQEFGLYRYLLTMLDGLEGKSSTRVCVMLTAMDVGSLPPALVRSGASSSGSR